MCSRDEAAGEEPGTSWFLRAAAEKGTGMTQWAAARDRLDRADDLPALLEAAHQGFAVALAALRAGENPESVWFAGFVMAAAEAANGRDGAAVRPGHVAGRRNAGPGHRTADGYRGGRWLPGRTRRGASLGISPRCAA